MARRQSKIKRRSKYSGRSSEVSGFLNPNSEILGEEEPFWWNKLSNNTNTSLERYNVINETTKQLHSDSQNQASNVNHQWWLALEKSDSSSSEEHIETVPQKNQSKNVTSSTDEEDYEKTDLPLRKRKLQIRKKSIEEEMSNNFAKVMVSSKHSKTSVSNSEKSIPIKEHTNDDASSIKKSLQELNLTEKQTSTISDVRSSSSVDEYHISNDILKPKKNIFRKKHKRKSIYQLENFLKTNNDLMNKSKTTDMTSSDSSNKLIDNKNTSKDTIIDTSKDTTINTSKEEKLKLVSSGVATFKEFFKNSTLNDNESKFIYHTRTDSSLSVLSSSPKSAHLDLVSNAIIDRSNKSVSKNAETNEKISSIIKNNESSIKHPTTPQEVRDSTAKTEKIENHETPNKNKTPNKNETSLASMKSIHKSNKSNMEDDINLQETNSNLRRTINASQRENMDEENLLSSSTKKNKTFQTISNNVTSKKSTNLSNFRSNKINDIENERSTSSTSSDSTEIINLKQKSLRTTNVIDDEQNPDHQIDNSNHKTSDIINNIGQKKIDEYFTTKNSINATKFTPTNATTSTPTNARQSKNLQIPSVVKKNIGTKKKVDKKVITNNTKLIAAHFDEIISHSSMNRKEMLEKIKELKNMGKTTKKLEKKVINKAYIVNGEVYKRPRLPRPYNWVTNRLYQFLWKKMKPKYESLTRVNSEKFVKELSDAVSFITKTKKYEDYEILLNSLMENMAKLGIIITRDDFYHFSHEFLPYDFRIKVIPMLLPGNVRNIPYDPKTVYEPILKNSISLL
ncbi:hypothetical protein M0802_010470 [Mischocyttarus mexicanus]|nr:hypothetical protein M0802_010470 [Mischocyttarus mexicanus]